MLGFFVSVIPILPIFHTFVAWVIELITHQGLYGTGAAGIMSPTQLTTNMSELAQSRPLVFLLTGLWFLMLPVIAVLHRYRGPIAPRIWALAGGLSIQIGVTFLLILKHPRPTYLLSIVAVFPLMLALLHTMLGSSHRYTRYFYLIMSIAIGLTLFINVRGNIAFHQQNIALINTQHAISRSFIESYAQSIDTPQDELTILWSFHTYTHCLSLHFGNVYTNLEKNAFARELDTLCPQHGYIEIRTNLVSRPDGTRIPVEQTPWDILIISAGYHKYYTHCLKLGTVSHNADGTLIFVTRQNP